MPYEAAQAVAATFCHPIRHALMPLFGPGFPSRCRSPDDPAFGRMVVDRAIVRRSTALAHEYRRMAQSAPQRASTSDALPTPQSTSSTPGPSLPIEPRPLRLDTTTANARHGGRWDRYAESGYGTDTDTSDRTVVTPRLASREEWAFVGPRRGQHTDTTSSARRLPVLPTLTIPSPPQPQPWRPAKKRARSTDTERYDDVVWTPPSGHSPPVIAPRILGLSLETRAAYMLMQMSTADDALAVDHRDKRRRIST